MKETESNEPDEIKSKISDEEFHAIRVQLREKKRAAQVSFYTAAQHGQIIVYPKHIFL